MAEEQKSVAKESLQIRQNLVDAAAGFLLNPSVKLRSYETKLTFLRNKGLTDSEIVKAFTKAKCETGTAVVSSGNSQLVNAYPLPPYQSPYSFWFLLRGYSSLLVSFAAAVYVLHRFYKSYIEPWLFGSKSKQSEISALKEQLTELNNSVSRLTSTVASLEESVHKQIHQIDSTSLYGVESIPKSVRDIQEEVSSVKSLLLNRFSFPAPPSFAGARKENKTQDGDSKTTVKVVTIPKWQLQGSEYGKSKVDSKEQLDESECKESSSTSEPSSPGNSLSSVEDQTQDQENSLKIAKDNIIDKDSKAASENCVGALEDNNENSNECLENNLSAKGKIEDEDFKTGVENQVRNKDEKTLDDDSESTDQTNEKSRYTNSE